MNIPSWIVIKTGIAPELLFGPNGLVELSDLNGVITITKWDVSGIPQPSASDLKAALAAPDQVNPAVVKAICQDFVYSYADTNTQVNATALIASGKATDAQKTGYAAALDWITACRAQCAALIKNNDTSYSSQKATYPVPSSEIVDFINTI